jgi:hypothetical protein
MRTHQELDQRSLALHRLVADKIRRDPALLDQARRTLSRWRETVCERSQPYLYQWEQVLNTGLEASLALAVEDSERATALRQSSPFSGLLTNQERFAFLKAWKQEHASQRA